MELFTTRTDLRNYLSASREQGRSIGLVPTMGALHDGHLALIGACRAACDVTVCSVFVNPTQFNDPADLEKYPRTPDRDARLLEAAGCDVLFMPDVDEMYTPGERWHLDLGDLETILEGKFRPGHFQGVTQVVSKLFAIVEPDTAFFGQKDYQQFAVIARMVTLLNMPVRLVSYPIVREESGLAMSSRNTRLSASGRRNALAIVSTLRFMADHFGKMPVEALKREAMTRLGHAEGVSPEYVEIADTHTLQPAADDARTAVALVAARVDDVRLIDNMMLFS